MSLKKILKKDVQKNKLYVKMDDKQLEQVREPNEKSRKMKRKCHRYPQKLFKIFFFPAAIFIYILTDLPTKSWQP